MYLSDKQVAERYSVTRQTVWRWSRERADFPKAANPSPGCTRWKLADLEAWETAHVSERGAA